MTLVRVYDNDGTWDVEEPLNLKARGNNSFIGWKCSVGQRNLYINHDGDIYRGTCRVTGKVGNVYEETLTMPDGWVTCDKQKCNCVTEIQLPKAKDLNEPERNSIIPIQDYPVYIQWDIGRRCNFDCSYCPSFVHNATDGFRDIDILKDIVVRLHESFKEQLAFNFAGGEPTMHPDFVEWCQFITKLGHMVHVQTNGAQVKDYWKRLVPYVNSISISVHMEFMTENRLMQTVDSILKADGNLEVKIMAHPDHWEKVMKYKMLLKNLPLQLLIMPLRTSLGRNTELMEYTPEQLKEMGTVNTV